MSAAVAYRDELLRALYWRTTHGAGEWFTFPWGMGCYKCGAPMDGRAHPWRINSLGCRSVYQDCLFFVVGLMAHFRPHDIQGFLPAGAPLVSHSPHAFWLWCQEPAADGTHGWANFQLAFEASATALGVLGP